MIIEIKNDNGGEIMRTEVTLIGFDNNEYAKYQLTNGDIIIHNTDKGLIDLAIKVLKMIKKNIK